MLRYSLATKWRRSLAGGESPRKRREKERKAPKGRCSKPSLNSSVAPSGLSDPMCDKTVGFRPRLNSYAASRLKTAQHQNAQARERASRFSDDYRFTPSLARLRVGLVLAAPAQTFLRVHLLTRVQIAKGADGE